MVYVYPKDDTPGCTIQGKSFTASKEEFDAANIAVVGVSADDVDSHKSFCNKFGFTIDLLADPEHQLLNAAGVGQSEYKGTMYWDRTSFVIDPDGNLQRTYLKVQPDGHERMLLDDIKEHATRRVIFKCSVLLHLEHLRTFVSAIPRVLVQTALVSQ